MDTLKLTPQEIEELIAVRESVHSAFETNLKSTTECPDRDSNAEDTNRALNLWLPSTSPSAKSDDAIQLSRTVILYVKVLTTHQDTKYVGKRESIEQFPFFWECIRGKGVNNCFWKVLRILSILLKSVQLGMLTKLI